MKVDEIILSRKKKRRKGLHKKEKTTEALVYAPLNKDTLDRLEELFGQPIIMGSAIASLDGLINDEGLYDEIDHANPKDDARPVIRKWIELNMPHLLYKEEEMMGNGEGLFSILYGYDNDNNPNAGTVTGFSP